MGYLMFTLGFIVGVAVAMIVPVLMTFKPKNRRKSRDLNYLWKDYHSLREVRR
jgi:hypothetical protein